MLVEFGEFCKQRDPTNKLPEIDESIVFKPRVVVVDDQASPEYVYKQVKITFNKLTLDNFERILDKFWSILVGFLSAGMDETAGEPTLFEKVVELIVSKAQMEPTFCNMYVNFCRCVKERMESVEKGLGEKFLTCLLTRCKGDFEADREAAFTEVDELDIPEDEREEKRLILKLRYVGLMRFIGELYQYDMVKAKVMHGCIEDLLNSTEEEKLVCVCKLLQVIGHKLEEYYTMKKKPATFQNFIATMRDKSDDTGAYSSRLRFMFKDVIELQENKWISRNEPEKAMKIKSSSSGDMGAGSGIRMGGGDARNDSGGGEWVQASANQRRKAPSPGIGGDARGGPGGGSGGSRGLPGGRNTDS